MKDMSKRDKMIIIIMTIIIILVAGFFALIRPKYQQLVADTETFVATQTEWQGIDAKLNAIPGLKDTITEAYNKSNKTAQLFVNEVFADVTKNYSDEKANVVADEHIQPAIDESSLRVNSMDITGVASQAIEYYYYTPNVVTYSLLEAADINGNYANEISDLLLNSMILGETATAEVMANTVNLNLTGNKESLMLFLDAIKDDKNAILVESVSVNDYTFTGGLEEENQPAAQTPAEPQVDEEGNPIEPVAEAPQQTPSNVAAGEGTSEMTISVVFYNAKPIDTPDLGD